jgi:hypothetical protein
VIEPDGAPGNPACGNGKGQTGTCC